MVISKDGKRKRKEISTPAIDKTAEITKRTKVHAQRKFAQGQSSSTFQLATNLSTATTTTQPCAISKDTQPVLPPTELITHKRPNTEDFLTFLCFRGTPILPPHLDYFNSNRNNNNSSNNVNNVNNNNEYEESQNFQSKNTTTAGSSESPTDGQSEINGNAAHSSSNIPCSSTIEIPKPSSMEKNVNTEIKHTPPVLPPEKPSDNKDGFIPFGVRKRAEQIPNRDKMQALRKKYHDQRIAKLRSKGYVKSRTQIQTRSNLNAANIKITKNETEKATATIAAAIVTPVHKERRVLIPEPEKIHITPKLEPVKHIINSEIVKNNKKSKVLLVANNHKPCLRSNKQTKKEVANELNETVVLSSPTTKIKVKNKKIGKLKNAEIKVTSASESPSCSSIKKCDDKPAVSVRQTRNTRFSKTDNVVLKPNKIDEDESESEDYSSADDEPLAVTIARKSKELGLTPDLGGSPGKSTRSKRYFEKVDEKITKSNVSKRGPAKMKKIEKIDAPIVFEVPAAELGAPKIEVALPTPKQDSILYLKAQEEISPAPQKRQYKKKKLIHEIEKSNETQPQSSMDHSESEARVPRLSRKTKEAATIYMELIGRKLTSNDNDADDDNQSIDSFPELPNARKTQKMENELKEKYKNNKNEKVSIIEVVKKESTKVKATTAKTTVTKKLEKSFSDSDEEPLATKAYRKNIKKSFSDLNEIEKPRIPTQSNVVIGNLNETIKSEVKKETIKYEPKMNSPLLQFKPNLNSTTTNFSKLEDLQPPDIPNPKEEILPKTTITNLLLSPFQRTTFVYDLKDDLESSKLNQTNDLNNKSFEDLSLERMSKSLETENDLMKKLREVEEMAILKSENSAKQMKLTTSSTMRDLMNPLPSMEESGKIFGIACVSLAQSSGPIDTKCTLGKCGSIHKPSLGPVVPTEAILGEQLSSKERRRAKVNMTHEQIQKWLIESCVTPDPDVMSSDFIDMSDLDGPLKPINYGKSISPFKDIDESHLSQSTSSRQIKSRPDKIMSGRDKISTVSSSSNLVKGPSLKAKPVVIKDEAAMKEKTFKEELSNLYSSERVMPQDIHISQLSLSSALQTSYELPKSLSQKTIMPANNEYTPKLFPNKEKIVILEMPKPQPQIQQNKTNPPIPVVPRPVSVPAVSVQQIIHKDKEPVNRKTSPPANTPKNTVTEKHVQPKEQKTKPEPKAANTKAKASKPQNQKRNATDRKLIFNQRRTPVYNTKLPDSSKTKLVVNSFGAFSPENETSIYSFDKEDDVIPVATPFRRHSRRESNENIRQDDMSDKVVATTSTKETSTSDIKKEEDERTPKKNVPSQPEVSLTLSPEENTKSASIAVQVSLEEMNPIKEMFTTTAVNKSPNEKATENNDSDSDGHTFYIPLQGTNLTSGKSDQIIQGVSVKLGTEGPEGPNQRVIMHAKLVTKTHMGTTSTPLPETVGNVQELVKSLIAGKESCKSVPIGTVQPRFKSSNSTDEPNATCNNTPSQSPLQTPQNNSSAQLSRVNSNSSLASIKNNPKTQNRATKAKSEISLLPMNNTAFPMPDDSAQMVDAPVFRPTEKEFADPMEYIERLAQSPASRFGLCKIIPPDSFKPDCQLSDEIRFNAYNQYVHRMLNRWGPNTKELCAIKKYLTTQNISMAHPPWIGGMEVDLPRLYHTVQELGGLKDVIEKKKWTKVAEEMCIPKTAHDRVTKLDDIYCKYLLPYDTLSPAERQKLFDEVEADWAKREAKARRNADRCMTSESVSNDGSDDDDDSDESDSGDIMECIVKGRSMPLSAFFRIARNTMSVWFKNSEPDTSEIEAEFWRHVAVRDCHICVHSGSIDSSGWGYGFPTPGPKAKSSPCAKHPWNLKVLTNHSGSVLRSLGPVMGVTVPTLQFGMLFSACCWYRDPHGLPWIEYLHTGSSKIWYGVPDEQSANFRSALIALVPTHCQNKTIWLPSDTAMVPPHMLTERNVSLCRTEQLPGEYVVVFPRAYTSSVCTGYVVSESVYFATNSWLATATQDFKDIEESCEPVVFSLEQLLFAISSDTRSNHETLVQILPMATDMYEKEVALRSKLKAVGITKLEKLTVPKNRKQVTEENECDICRANLYISMVKTDDEGAIYCIPHAIKYIKNNRLTATTCKLIYAYSVEEIDQMLEGLRERINQQKQKLSTKKQNPTQGSNRYGKC